MPDGKEDELFKILSADTRLTIIDLLKHGPMIVSEIAETLEISQSAISQHLRLMKYAGLVRMERDGYYIAYSLNNEKLLELRSRLSEVCTCGCHGCRQSSLNVLKEYEGELQEELERIRQLITEFEDG